MTNKQEVAEANYTVYQHIAPNGKRYIGITSLKPEKRWLNGRGYNKNIYFFNAIKKYGWCNFKHIIVETNLTKDKAEEMEKNLISMYRANDHEYGYNWASGGSTYKHSKDSKEKMRKSHLGLRYNIGVPFTEERKRHLSENHADVSGKNNPCYGKKWTTEQIAIRQSHRVYKTGGDNPTAKKIAQCLDDGTIVKIWGSISEASKFYCRTSLKDCLKGKYKHHKGYVWKYYKGEEYGNDRTDETKTG